MDGEGGSFAGALSLLRGQTFSRVVSVAAPAGRLDVLADAAATVDREVGDVVVGHGSSSVGTRPRIGGVVAGVITLNQ